MSWITTSCAALLTLALSACGGRAHIDDRAGHAYRRVFTAQVESEPRRALATLGADEAKGIMGNHAKRYHGNARGSSGPTARWGGSAGQLSPLLGEALGGGDGGEYNSSPIKLKAK